MIEAIKLSWSMLLPPFSPHAQKAIPLLLHDPGYHARGQRRVDPVDHTRCFAQRHVKLDIF
jgi:hypothetical protein